MFNSYQFSGSYNDLLKLMTQHAQQEGIDDQILDILKQFFEKEIGRENRPLSRPERIRLFQEVTKAILTDVLEKIDGSK
jgi:hypothetical protein